MRILFCCPTPIDARLGASKVYLEVAEGFRRLGWAATVVGPDEVAGGRAGDLFAQPGFLRRFLQTRAADYEVVEYEHNQLPFPRTDFPPGPVFVARSVMLAHSQAAARIPPLPTLRGRLGRVLKGWGERRWGRALVSQADQTLRAADLINVSNTHDRETLVRRGHAADKILVLPYGLFPERLAAFSSDPDAIPDPPVAAFVGTFDPRKGLRDFPRIVTDLARTVPGVRFKFLGTAGMLRTAGEVYAHFPRRLRPLLEVVPRFEPEALPGLLADCSVGVFPSLLEAFGFGVLEMLAAGLPVIAYRVPGPPEMLPDAYLVPRGDAAGVAARAAALVTAPDQLRAARRWARKRAADFDWDDVVRKTAARYAAAAGERGRGGVNILRIADIRDDRTGGASRYVHFATDEMRRAGHRVDLVFADGLSTRGPGRLRRFLTPVGAVRVVLDRLRRGTRYDVVEIHEASAAGYAVARRARPSLPPLLVSVYGLEARAREVRLGYARAKGLPVSWKSRVAPLSVIWQANFALRAADHVIVETTEDAAYLSRRLGVPPGRVSMQHGGVAPVFFEPADGPRGGVLFVGTWIERKGIRDLVPALAGLLARRPDVPVTVAGCGCPVDRVLGDFPAGVRERVRVIPAITDDARMAELYRAHAVFAFPSTFEGLPLALLEAAASGLAIATTRTCGMKDFVADGENGLLVEVGDAAGFAAALARLVDDPGLAGRLGAAARRAARLYTWARSAEQFLAAATAAATRPWRRRVSCRA